MRKLLAIAIGAAISGLIACSTTPPNTVLDERIIIPDDATQVERIDFFTRRELVHLNQHMLILRSGTRPYLVVFDSACLNLNHRDPNIVYRTKETSALYARSDVLLVDGAPCQVDRIYSITSADEIALRKQIRS